MQGLGSWRCTGCKKVCSVTVSKYKPAETLTQNGWKPSDALIPGDEVRSTIPASTPEMPSAG
jgi:hypothetical protein